MPKCPLFIIGDRRAQLGEETEIGDCIKEGCAMFDKLGDRCSILQTSRVLEAIGSVLGRIHAELCLSKYRYTCHYCGAVKELSPSNNRTEPATWRRHEQVDGRYVWSCRRCSGEEVD